jgi:RNA polymerase sigma factor (sigma-70 family)
MDWIRKSARQLRGVLFRRGLRRHDVEDVIQDAFLRMQVYCKEGGHVRNPEAFLVRTAVNLSLNSQCRARAHVSVEDARDDIQRVLGVEPAPEDVLAGEESMLDVQARIEAMPPRAREVFLLHYIDEYTYPQISQLLGISVSAIEKHMARAMLRLTERE